MISILKNQEQQQYQQYPQRFLIASIFFLLSFMSGACWVVVSPISVSIAKAYHQSPTVVSLISMSYMLFYVIVNFPSNWMLDVKGVRTGVLVGAILTSLGSAIRCLVFYDFYLVILGQFLCAIGQPFILNATTKVAVRWFLPESVQYTENIEICHNRDIVHIEHNRNSFWLFDAFFLRVKQWAQLSNSVLIYIIAHRRVYTDTGSSDNGFILV
jgi:fucose permease